LALAKYVDETVDIMLTRATIVYKLI